MLIRIFRDIWHNMPFSKKKCFFVLYEQHAINILPELCATKEPLHDLGGKPPSQHCKKLSKIHILFGRALTISHSNHFINQLTATL